MTSTQNSTHSLLSMTGVSGSWRGGGRLLVTFTPLLGAGKMRSFVIHQSRKMFRSSYLIGFRFFFNISNCHALKKKLRTTALRLLVGIWSKTPETINRQCSKTLQHVRIWLTSGERNVIWIPIVILKTINNSDSIRIMLACGNPKRCYWKSKWSSAH